MEQYVTYHKILDFIKNYQEQAVGLNSFGHGDLVYFATTNSGTTVYPLVFVTPQQITYDENITQYQLSIIFGDIVNTDLSNQEDVLTDMSIQAKRFISQFKRGQFIEKMDITLPVLSTPFIERFNDHIGGVVLDCQITVFEDLNACDYYEPSPTPTSSPTPTPTPTCPVTQQYMEVDLSDNTKFKLILWNDSGFTSPAVALCDYVVSGTAYGSLGTTYTGTETITEAQHQHQFDLAPVLLPGETVTGFTVYSVNTSTCVCPVNVDFSPYVPVTPTPTATPSPTPTPTI